MDKIKEKADKYADDHGFSVPYDGSNKFYDDTDVKASREGFIAGANEVINNPQEYIDCCVSDEEIEKLADAYHHVKTEEEYYANDFDGDESHWDYYQTAKIIQSAYKDGYKAAQTKPGWVDALTDIDCKLIILEDHLHGEDGKTVTALRGQIERLIKLAQQ